MPGVWSGIGGHVETTEYGDVKSACLREIEEETGLQSDDVHSLQLKYVLLRQRQDELRQQFIYFGTALRTDLGMTDEGTLHWIPYNQLFTCKMTNSNQFMLEHYFKNKSIDNVWVGTMYGEDNEPRMSWSIMSDWE